MKNDGRGSAWTRRTLTAIRFWRSRQDGTRSGAYGKEIAEPVLWLKDGEFRSMSEMATDAVCGMGVEREGRRRGGIGRGVMVADDGAYCAVARRAWKEGTPKMNKAMEEGIAVQLGAELDSAYLYLSISAHFASEGLPGFAQWMRVQAREELAHAMRFFDHLVDRGGRVQLSAIDRPPSGFGSPLAVFEQVLEHEKRITASIHALHDLAVKEGDHASQPLLLSFISEQIEEEKTSSQIVDQLRMLGDQKGPLLFLDRHLGKRQD